MVRTKKEVIQPVRADAKMLALPFLRMESSYTTPIPATAVD